MNNKDKMLHLVLSDQKLRSSYEYSLDDLQTIQDALKSENPVVVVVAKIILEIGENSDKVVFKEIYNEVVNYLNKNIL
jgi:hypothetical protein